MTNHVLSRGNDKARSFAQGAMAGLLWLSLSSGAQAMPVVFTNSASFLAALPGPSSVVDFDAADAEMLIPEGAAFEGITFTTNTALDLIVSDHFDTTSPHNYLGVADDFSNEFLSGHELTFSFAGRVQAFGLFIIASPGAVLAADFQLLASSVSVFNVAPPERILLDGGEVFFLGVIDPTGFASAQLISFGDPDDPFFGFNVDDLTTFYVPEPATLALVGLGLLALCGRKAAFRTASKSV